MNLFSSHLLLFLLPNDAKLRLPLIPTFLTLMLLRRNHGRKTRFQPPIQNPIADDVHAKVAVPKRKLQMQRSLPLWTHFRFYILLATVQPSIPIQARQLNSLSCFEVLMVIYGLNQTMKKSAIWLKDWAQIVLFLLEPTLFFHSFRRGP